MSTQHTPGPWAIFNSTILPDATFGIDGADGSAVVFFGFDDNSGIRKIEDARLIAAAPELLEALRVCATQSTGPDWTPEQALDFIKQHARAAIAKAEGKQ